MFSEGRQTESRARARERGGGDMAFGLLLHEEETKTPAARNAHTSSRSAQAASRGSGAATKSPASFCESANQFGQLSCGVIRGGEGLGAQWPPLIS